MPTNWLTPAEAAALLREIQNEQKALIARAREIYVQWPSDSDRPDLASAHKLLDYFDALSFEDFPATEEFVFADVRAVLVRPEPPAAKPPANLFAVPKRQTWTVDHQPALLLRIAFAVAWVGCKDNRHYEDETAAGRIAYAHELLTLAKRQLQPAAAPPAPAERQRPRAAHFDKAR